MKKLKNYYQQHTVAKVGKAKIEITLNTNQQNKEMLAICDYSVRKKGGKITIDATNSFQLKMPIEINKAFTNDQLSFNYLADEEEYQNSFSNCDGKTRPWLIFNIHLAEVFPDLTNSWPIRTAFSENIYCLMGTIKAGGKNLMYLLSMEIVGSMTLYVFELHRFTEIMLLIEDQRLLHLLGDNFELKVERTLLNC